ncbi:MAG: DUF2971 domain-containing protein [Gallionella sp.]
MKSDDEIYGAFQALWQDIQHAETFPVKRPLLAHYTSIATLERIMVNDEIWFSNPLYMNDMEELRFGILEGAQAFRQHEAIKFACNDPKRYDLLLNAFEYQLNRFSNEHAFDTYVFCLSEHDIEKDTDGLLSMWRGYGSNGNGAAIIFDAAQLSHIGGSPLIISKVSYASQDDRRQWIDAKFREFANLLSKNNVPDDKLYLPAYALFERIKMFSIFTKHRGFSEEKEWRVVYLRDRDVEHRMDGMLHYSIGRNGIEPKFKLKIKPINGVTSDNFSLDKIVSQIILGPSISSPLAVNSVRRMIETVGKHELANKLIASTTPFRSS